MATRQLSVVSQVSVFVVEIGGKRISGTARTCVTAFECDEKEKQVAECSIVISAQEGKFPIAIPQKGDKFRVRWGSLAQMSDTHEMRVHSVVPSYGGEFSIKVTARDLGAGLGRTVRHGVYERTQLGDVVKDIAKRAGLTAVLPQSVPGRIGGVPTTTAARGGAIGPRSALAQAPSSPREAALLRELVNLATHGKNDRVLLQEIAHRTGCEVHVVGKTLRFAPKGYAAAPALALRWRSGRGVLLAFQPKDGEGGKHEQAARGVKATGIDPHTGKPFAVKANDASAPGRPTLGKESPFGGPKSDGRAQPGGDVFTVSRRTGEVGKRLAGPAPQPAGAAIKTPSGKATDAARNARALHGDAEGGAVSAQMQLLGIPSVRKGRVLDVSGLMRRRDNGTWMVTAATHKIDASGYSLAVEVKRHGQRAVAKHKATTAGKPNEAAPRKAEQVPQPTYTVSRKTGELTGTRTR